VLAQIQAEKDVKLLALDIQNDVRSRLVIQRSSEPLGATLWRAASLGSLQKFGCSPVFCITLALFRRLGRSCAKGEENGIAVMPGRL